MKTNTIRDRLLASTMIGGVAIAAAVALPAAAVLVAPTTASAQDYTTGALSGTVSDQSGAPVAGATVTIRSNEQGFTRSFTTAANGTFRAALIPPGTYEVTVNAEGYDSFVEPSVAVQVNSNNSYRFTVGSAGADAGADLGEVIVVGTRPELDFSQNATGLTVNVDELVERVPLGRSVTSVALLAPRAIEGDSAFGNQPSLGGSSVAENAFYVNGLNITDFNTYVGAAGVPFDFYRTVDVQTGGYSAEFGRATGGIINAVTKSGTNEWIFELHGNWAPDELRESAPIVLSRSSRSPTAVTGAAGTLNAPTPQNRPDLTVQDSWSIIAEAGGPIIQDRLYAYGLYQWSETDTLTVNNTATQNTNVVNDIPFWGAKIDAYITDTQRLEFTYFTTKGEFDTVVSNRATGDLISRSTSEVGGDNWVARYTGNWTDWLTLSAAYGESDLDNNVIPELDTIRATDLRGPNFVIPGSNPFATVGRQNTLRKFYRGDADVTFSAYGDHHIRFGFDVEETTLSRTSRRTGGAAYFYYTSTQLGLPNIGGSAYNVLDYEIAFFGGDGIGGRNEAWYIQDSWDINDNLNIQIGLRHDMFSLDNLVGEQVVELTDNFGPRVGFNLDPIGDGVDKFYGSYGRYFIPIASNLSYRGADLFYDVYLQQTPIGVTPYNPDGTPVGGLGPAIIDPGFEPCPATPELGVVEGQRSCSVNGDGTVEPADAKYAFGTKATNEDEFILGYERQLSDLWSVGAAVTYRKLNNVSEDIDVGYLVERYCVAQGIAGCGDADPTTPTGVINYIIANPGKDLTFLVQRPLPDGSRPVLTFTAEEAGIPKATREYAGLEFTFDREFDGVWSLSGSYVISESIGNYEGTVLSDNGQVDAGSTILYDHLGLTEAKYGLLPNHRGHQFKIFGAYTLMDSITIGANFSVTSPRKFACFGRSASDPDSVGYGASSNNCRPDILALAGNRDPYFTYVPFGQGSPGLIDTAAEYNSYAVLAPRGSVMESDWIYNLDMSFRYTMPTFGFMPEGITLRADVFNVFNSQGVTDLFEAGGQGSTVAGQANFGLPSGYQAPRSVRFGFDLRF